MSPLPGGGRRRSRASELAGAIMNLFLGVICISCGLSGAIVFIGTSSGVPFVVLGGVLLVVGGFRLWRWIARAFASARSGEDLGGTGGAPPENAP